MSQQRISDMEKGSLDPYRQVHEDPPICGWFTSLRRILGFDVEDDQLTPLWTTPAAVQDGLSSTSSAPALWPDLFAFPVPGHLVASPPGLVDSPPPADILQHSIHTF